MMVKGLCKMEGTDTWIYTMYNNCKCHDDDDDDKLYYRRMRDPRQKPFH